jgi:hypothetical protein
MSKKVTFKVDGEWFTDFIRNLYYAEDKSYEECKDKLIKTLNLDNISEDDKEELAQAVIFGEKKFIGLNDFELVNDTDFDVYEYSRFSRPKFSEYIEYRYAVGFLLKDGVFVQCRYKGHSDKLDLIREEKAEGSLIFQTDSMYDNYYVVKDDFDKCRITKHQKKWINDNKEYLTENQLRDIRRLIKIEESKEKELLREGNVNE